MSILKTCENCLFSSEHYPPFKMVCIDCHYAQNDKDDPDTCFQAKEHLIREDEKEKIIKRLEEKFNDLVCSDLFQNEAYAIKDIIDELKEK